MEFVTFILVAIFIVVLAAVLFGGWVIMLLFRGAFAMIRIALGEPQGPAALTATTLDCARCPRSKCHADNPVDAKFCRRCGTTLAGEPVKVRRVA